MRHLNKRIILLAFFAFAKLAPAADSVSGTYKAILQHDGSKFYQVATVVLRTIQEGGSLKVSATAKILFGDWTSTEFLTYEFDNVAYNFVTGQMSLKSEKNDVSLVGIFKPGSGTFQGEWFSSFIGKVGKFLAEKDKEPTAPVDGILVKTLTGHYRGVIKNTAAESNLPERGTITLVSTQDTSGSAPVIKITGTARLYLGEFGSFEYIETKFTDVQFNFYNRYFIAKTADYGLTYKGVMSHDGTLTGLILADGIGEAATVELKRYP